MVDDALAQEVAAAYNHRCAVGGSRCSGRLEIHHMRYKSRGGSDRRENLVLLCTFHHEEEHAGRGAGFSIGRDEPEPTEFPYRPRRRG